MKPHWIDQLFLRFGSIYGYLWTNQHTTTREWNLKRSQWGKTLADVTAAEIRRALALCAKEKTKLPTLPEFRLLAKQTCAERTHHAAYREWEHHLLLPRPRANPILVKACLAQMRAHIAAARTNQSRLSPTVRENHYAKQP